MALQLVQLQSCLLLNSDWRLWIAAGLGGHLPRHTAVNLVALTCSSAQWGRNNVCVFQLLVFWFLPVIVVVLERLVMGNRVVLRVERPRPVQLMLAQVFLVILLAAAWAENQDYYSLLGVSKEATTREIRRAFKKLALTMHPDKNQVSLLWETRNTDFAPKLTTTTYFKTKTPNTSWLLSRKCSVFKGDPSAHEKFLKVNRAYEVLKDEDLRKKYDKYGEKGLDEQQQGGRYESWNYYRYDFGKSPLWWCYKSNSFVCVFLGNFVFISW